MHKNVLLGLNHHTLPVPPVLWRQHVDQEAQHSLEHIRFMTPAHHLLRDLVVMELPRQGKPLTTQWIAEKSGLPVEQVVPIIDDLERHLTFLYRNPQGAVAWAYPVTTDVTPHRITFNSGEQIYAA